LRRFWRLHWLEHKYYEGLLPMLPNPCQWQFSVVVNPPYVTILYPPFRSTIWFITVARLSLVDQPWYFRVRTFFSGLEKRSQPELQDGGRLVFFGLQSRSNGRFCETKMTDQKFISFNGFLSAFWALR
jgi:hypothetical protein